MATKTKKKTKTLRWSRRRGAWLITRAFNLHAQKPARNASVRKNLGAVLDELHRRLSDDSDDEPGSGSLGGAWRCVEREMAAGDNTARIAFDVLWSMSGYAP